MKSYVSHRKPWELPKIEYNKLQGQGRKATNQWFYKSKPWRNVRMVKLSINPFCECNDCKNKGWTLQADVVDHIKPVNPNNPYLTLHGEYGEPLSLDNLMSMTTRCHNKKSAKEAHNGISL